MYAFTGSVSVVESAAEARDTVCIDIAVTVSEPFPAAVLSEIPPAANKLANVFAETDLPVESSTDTNKVAFSPGA